MANNNNQIKVSIIVTCFNLEQYISRAIRSCLNQTIPEDEYEVIVVDDASSDSSRMAIQSFGSQLIKPIFLDENVGVAEASNIGIRAASGKYIIRVDGDDYINKNTLLVMSEILGWNEDIGFVYCDHIVVTEGQEERRMEINTLEKLLNHGAGMMFRKFYMESIGLYDPELRNAEDYDLVLRYMENFSGYHIRAPYYRYFKRPGSLSTKKRERENIQQRIRDRNTGGPVDNVS
jgi:glycosyltransferase involved in cell wall biosynthesis